MQNFINDGTTLVLTAPRNVASGEAFQVGVVVAVATSAALAGAPVVAQRTGRFTLPVNPADTPTVGAILYWDNTNFRLTTTPSTNKVAGLAATTKSAANTVEVILTGQIA